MVARVQDLGRALGLDINPDKQQTAATYDAHRLVQAAKADGDARALVERLHRAHFSEGLDISDAAVLRALAAECGMDARRAREVLDGDAYAGDVERDERDAALRGIGGVPYTVLGGRLSVSGAQSVAVFSKALRQASGSNALGVNL
jgi:predicted DsbA family dithiol-disulfide isomerase